MTRQLSIFDTEVPGPGNGLTTPHHLNHKVSGKPGLQNLTEVPGLVFCEGFLTRQKSLSASNASMRRKGSGSMT